MQRENEKKGSYRSGRSTEKKKVRFLLGGQVFYPNPGGENATLVNHGNRRPGSISHKQGAEQSKVREVYTNDDDGARKEMKTQEQNSDKGNKRPRSTPHKQGAEPSKLTQLGANDDDGARKDMKPQEQRSDKGIQRPRSTSHKKGAKPSKVTKVGTNDDNGARKEMKSQEEKSGKGNKRPRYTSHKQGAEPSKATEVGTNDDNGDRKEMKSWEQKSDKGNKRPRYTSHKQGAKPSKATEVGTNDDNGDRKEMKSREQKSDKGAGHHGLKVHTGSSSENLHIYPPNCPAQKIIWKGCFEVIGNIPEEDMNCDEFLAHPPAKLLLKAYEFSKKFPQIIQFRMYSRQEVWPEIFQTACPNSSDIALYFYPEKSKRSRKMYERLLKYIEAKDMALRTRIGSAELLVFTSKLLDMDSRKLDESYFLWGVFRSLKAKKS